MIWAGIAAPIHKFEYIRMAPKRCWSLPYSFAGALSNTGSPCRSQILLRHSTGGACNPILLIERGGQEETTPTWEFSNLGLGLFDLQLNEIRSILGATTKEGHFTSPHQCILKSLSSNPSSKSPSPCIIP